MPIDTRVRLLDWAGENNILVIEDDYDSEARFRRSAQPALFELAASHRAEVVHIGTFSTLLTTAVSTGYLLATGRIGLQLKEARRRLGPAYPPVMQAALAAYLGSGGLRRRIARGRRRLNAAEAVVAELGPIPGLVHRDRTLVIETTAAAALNLRRELEAQAILVASLADGWTGDEGRHGIVLAHSNVDAELLRRCLLILRALLNG